MAGQPHEHTPEGAMTYPNPPLPESLPPSLRMRKRPIELLDVALCVAYIGLGLGVAWTLQFGSDRFHDTPAVELIAALGVHWSIVASAFAVYALLLTNRWTRTYGWALGTVLFAFYFVSLVHAEFVDTVSILALAAGLAAVLSQISGLIRSLIAAEWRGE